MLDEKSNSCPPLAPSNPQIYEKFLRWLIIIICSMSEGSPQKKNQNQCLF